MCLPTGTANWFWELGNEVLDSMWGASTSTTQFAKCGQ